MKRISLIVPIYNAEPYLRDMVASVLAQGWDNLQLILAEGGSTDASPQIAAELQAAHPCITVVSGPNLGVSANRNRALQVADGDYIGFSDADDMLAPGYFCALAELLEKYGTDVAVCGFTRIYEASGVRDTMPPKDRGVFTTDRDGFLTELLRPDGFTTVVWNKLFRREALTGPDGSLLRFDETLHIVEDGEYLLRSGVQTAAFTCAPFYSYSVRTGGAMYGAMNERKLTELTARRRIAESAEASTPEVQALARMKYQKGVRDLFFHAVIGGSRAMVKPYLGEMRTWRRELFTSPFLSKKEKLKYMIYRPLILLNCKHLSAFLMKKLSGH